MSLHNCLKRDVIKLRLFSGANKNLNMKENKKSFLSLDQRCNRIFIGQNISKFISAKERVSCNISIFEKVLYERIR